MTNYKLLLLLGFVVLFVPFLGIPEIIREWIVVISSLVLISYAFYARSIVRKENFDEKSSVYVDSDKESPADSYEKEFEQITIDDDIKEEIIEEASTDTSSDVTKEEIEGDLIKKDEE